MKLLRKRNLNIELLLFLAFCCLLFFEYCCSLLVVQTSSFAVNLQDLPWIKFCALVLLLIAVLAAPREKLAETLTLAAVASLCLLFADLVAPLLVLFYALCWRCKRLESLLLAVLLGLGAVLVLGGFELTCWWLEAALASIIIIFNMINNIINKIKKWVCAAVLPVAAIVFLVLFVPISQKVHELLHFSKIIGRDYVYCQVPLARIYLDGHCAKLEQAGYAVVSGACRLKYFKPYIFGKYYILCVYSPIGAVCTHKIKY
ncbi:MAG: hypothetical protein GXO42_02585 [bacterium]|nr:hypothetical protein [bacterium]